MRRGSLFAPLLLIGLGALLLARNIYPDLKLLDYMARFWPVLLILWGVLRISEIAIWAATDKPLPPRGISQGEWVLVVVLCLFGATLHAVRGFSGWFPGTIELGGLDVFGETYDYPITGTVAATPSTHVVLENFRGNARISGLDTQMVSVTGHKTVRSMDQDGADKTNREAPLELAGGPGNIVIRTNQNRAEGLHRVTEDMEITVPRGASIEAHGRYGDFDIHDVDGQVEITSDHASVRLANLGGAARLNLTVGKTVRVNNVKGSVDVKGDGSDIDVEDVMGPVTVNGVHTGNIQFHNLAAPLHLTSPRTEFMAERVPGEVQMSLRDINASKIVGPVHVQTRLRDVQISDFTNGLDVNVDNGDIALRPTLPLARIEARTRNGNITLALPQDARFDLNATTNLGTVVNDFGEPLSSEQSRRSATLRGSNGGAEVTMHTDRGRIVVRTSSPNEPPLGPTGRGLKGLKEYSKKIEE